MGNFKGGFLMFVDFNKVFNNKPQTQIALPPALVAYMNKSLPVGVKYIVDDEGNCTIDSENDSCTIGGFIFNPNEEQKKVLGKNYTLDDVLKYLYNWQKPIPVILQTDGYIILNGKEFPVDKISFNPLNPIKYVSGSFYIYPHPLPDPFLMTVGCDKYKRQLSISRVPHNSVDIAAFESRREEPLYISYLVNEKTHALTFNISFNLKYAKSVRDMVESTMIYNAFFDGKGLLMGRHLKARINKTGGTRYDDDSAIFWEKVLMIEKLLKVHFEPPQENVDIETICLVEQLYQNLVNKLPTRNNQTINSINGNSDGAKIEANINDFIGKPVYFEFEAMSHIELFGVKKELPTLIGIINAVCSEYSTHGKEKKLVLVDESKEKKRYTSIMYFKSEKELNEYIKMDHNKRIEQFRDAKKPYEYIKQ